MGASPQDQARARTNELSRLYHAAQKLMAGEAVKCHRCLAPLRFDEAEDGKVGIVCDTGCTRFYLDVRRKRR